MDLENRMMPLVKGADTREGYIRMLQGMYAFLAPLEQKVLTFITPEMLPDKEERRNIQLMANDLEQLGSNPDRTLKPELPEIDNAAQAFGALYVLEGSTMGGMVVAGMLRRQLPEAAQHFGYFQSYGKETRAKWNLFRTAINNYIAANPEQADTVAQAAGNTFSSFGDWLKNYQS